MVARILVIEDNPTNMELMVYLLGHSVTRWIRLMMAVITENSGRTSEHRSTNR